jgi:hypothetical protein
MSIKSQIISEESNGLKTSRSLGLPMIKINHQHGNFIMSEKAVGDTDLGNTIKFTVLAIRGQYLYFDVDTETLKYLSPIDVPKNLKNASCLITRKPLSEIAANLEKQGAKMTYIQVVFGYTEMPDRYILSWFPMKGSAIKAWIEYFGKNPPLLKEVSMGLKKNKKGSIIYYTPEIKGVSEEIKIEDEVLKTNYENIKEMLTSYNKGDKELPQHTEDDDELPF